MAADMERGIQEKIQKPIDIDTLYDALCKTCDVLEELSCDYFLTGGTLLGARRAGDLIAHDMDFDLDCLVEHEQTILGAEALFAAKGLTIRKKLSMVPCHFHTFKRTERELYTSCIVVEYEGQHVGDICFYTIFDDGIARRFDLDAGLYSNPKMAIPGWYYSGDEYLSIRGRKFRSSRAPDLVLEKIYGTDWHIPLKPGEFQKGRVGASGAVHDADIEKLILYAIEHGWEACRENAPKWPQAIQWVGWPVEAGRDWILRHEPLVRPEMASILQDAALLRLLDQAGESQKQALLKVLVTNAIQSEDARVRISADRRKAEQSLLKRLYNALNLPIALRITIRKIYTTLTKWR